MTDLPPPPDAPPPPNQGGGFPPPPGQGGGPPAGYSNDPKEAKAQAKAAKAHAKAVRPWYKKKRFILGGILAVIIVIAIAAGGGGGDDEDGADSVASNDAAAAVEQAGSEDSTPEAADESTSQDEDESEAAPTVACKDAGPDQDLDTERQGLFPDRPDVQGSDHEAELGDCVRLAGYTTFVEGASVVPQEFGDPVLVVNVRIQNRDDSAQSYNTFDWSLLTPGGTVIDPTFTLDDSSLDSGDLVNGGEVAGNVAFDATDPGVYYVIYKPDPFNDVRGIWKVEI
ncbi:MAG: DUF4352 domain-containing protein [Acidimicrobiales bacterium]|nr:DUF4352 domain-containing protein [Acidimicrobiales bacterium]